MARKRKKSALAPRHKRMRRDQRIQAGRHWLSTYSGKNLLRGYKKHFAVDEVCALLELKALGQPIDDKKIEVARLAAHANGELKARRREGQKAAYDHDPNSDFHHYHIAGHTAGGFAYGITWEDAEKMGCLGKAGVEN